MTIDQIYTKYQVMPNLQTHMFRVTAVAQQICENLTAPINTEEVLSACLLHDMGNIIKFDLQKFPAFLEPEGLEFWQNVQLEYFRKYGHDEHEASIKIAREIGASSAVVGIVEAIGFDQIQNVVYAPDFAKKIGEYSDDRVTPFGVVSLDERLQDLEKRYSQKYPSEEDQQKRKYFVGLAHELEKQIFANCRLKPDDITDQTTNTRLENLQKFEIIGT